MNGKEIMDKDIVELKVNYIDFDDNEKQGIIEVHSLLAEEVKNIFDDIRRIEFPIERIEPIKNFNYSDAESVKANNTSSYNFRFVSGTNKLSDHAIGFAIDINPYQNPWVHPSALNLTTYDTSLKGTIIKNSDIVDIFKSYGWSWGGDWRNPDYQHFFKSGDLNKSVKDRIYNKLGIVTEKFSNLLNFTDYIKNNFNR